MSGGAFRSSERHQPCGTGYGTQILASSRTACSPATCRGRQSDMRRLFMRVSASRFGDRQHLACGRELTRHRRFVSSHRTRQAEPYLADRASPETSGLCGLCVPSPATTALPMATTLEPLASGRVHPWPVSATLGTQFTAVDLPRGSPRLRARGPTTSALASHSSPSLHEPSRPCSTRETYARCDFESSRSISNGRGIETTPDGVTTVRPRTGTDFEVLAVAKTP